jgi:hypothetical protein
MAGDKEAIGKLLDAMRDGSDPVNTHAQLLQYRTLCRAELRTRLVEAAKFVPPDTLQIILSSVGVAVLESVVQEVAWTAAGCLDDGWMWMSGTPQIKRVPFKATDLAARIAEAVDWAWKSSNLRHQAKLPLTF